MTPEPKKQKGATKARLAYRAKMLVGNRSNPPSGWHEQKSGELVCPHRDLSVCPDCLAANPECSDAEGAHFWIPLSWRNDPLYIEASKAL